MSKRTGILWRHLFFGRKNCGYCLKGEEWGNRCCWDCESLEECIPLWIRLDKGEYGLNYYCKYAKRKKWCSTILEIWKEKVLPWRRSLDTNESS